LSTWFPIETVYLAIQFTLGGFWLALVYRVKPSEPADKYSRGPPAKAIEPS
jgi:hypothetical protein